ncbi:MAG: hypothetical protein GY944_03375, partial [bacterium]|nr:hypothetical protein [bacterium]
LESGDIATAIRLAEALLLAHPNQLEAANLIAEAHERLLDNGGDVSFWENGWLETELARWQEIAGE